ncbi:MAG: diacylglycerol kinase family protein [Elusimicrobia bacterium]|nr:diacylglycerol kinase family protein [Elusimicrobiota bacterium]
MTNNTQFGVAGRVRSVFHAVNGLSLMLKSQHNARIHAFFTIAVIVSGFCFHLGNCEWCVIILAIAAVWAAEAFNTAIESLVNLASPEFHPLAGRAKDIAAGAVLISAIGSAAAGLVIFGPYFRALFIRVE